MQPSILRLLPSPSALESTSVKITEAYHDPFQSFSMDSELDWSDSDRSDSDRSAFDWSEVHSRYPGLIFDRETSLFPSTFYNNPHLLTRDEIHRSLLRQQGHLVPVEIFSEIFLYTIQADPRSRRELMLVCRHWHNITLSTPGVHSQLRIYSWTERKDVERWGAWT